MMLLKLERFRLTLTVMEVKTALAQDCKNSVAHVRCRLFIPSCSFEVKYLCRYNMYFCKYTSLLTGGSSTHKTSAGTRDIR